MGLSIGIGYNAQITKVYYNSGYPVNENIGGVSISAAFDF